MIRILIMVILAASFIGLTRATLVLLFDSPPASRRRIDKKSLSPKQLIRKRAADGPNISYYPLVPGSLPDFSQGYLFNEARSLEAAPGQGETDEGLAHPEIDAVRFDGSLITDDIQKALISYSDPPAPKKRRRPARRIGGSPGPRQTGRPPAPAGKRHHLWLTLGDSFAGYSVAAIHPEEIVFIKENDEIEKILYDPAKKRFWPAPARSKEGR